MIAEEKIVITSSDKNDLNNQIKMKEELGFIPSGIVSIYFDKRQLRTIFSQVMIKKN